MDSSNLTPEQARKVRDALQPQAAYLGKLADRMRARGFPFHDELTLQRAARVIPLAALSRC